MTEPHLVMPHGRASASEPGVDGVTAVQPPNMDGMTAASCVLRWGGDLDE